ncbi:MAG: aminodeoxychorismate synthase component I [Candidatus Omnitrophota bacterium]
MGYYILKSYDLKIGSASIFSVLKEEKNCFFLDTGIRGYGRLGRYSFLGIDPFYILCVKNKNPFGQLKALLDKYRISAQKDSPPFLGGAVGYFSYDLGFLLEEKLKMANPEDIRIPECFLGFYNTAIIIDNLQKRLYICAAGFPEKNYLAARALCRRNLAKVQHLLSFAGKLGYAHDRDDHARKPELESNFTKQGYIAAIKRAKDYIKAGDIYQVNLSQRFQAKTDTSAFDIYRRLRLASPSCFSAYLDCQDFQILSSSPERFLKLDSDRVFTRPMKGTRSRGRSKSEDASLKKALLDSNKDKAELTMIVDLERNDLGRACAYDSIRVDKLREIEKYRTVWQTTASISGRLRRENDRIDLLRACFPGGSVTGCPKIRAMEIIEELEPNRRGIYTGSLGYLSFSGSMDLNILIRTILKKGKNVYFGVGGGIVSDSRPEDEYRETLVKAKGMVEALG